MWLTFLWVYGLHLFEGFVLCPYALLHAYICVPLAAMWARTSVWCIYPWVSCSPQSLWLSSLEYCIPADMPRWRGICRKASSVFSISTIWDDLKTLQWYGNLAAHVRGHVDHGPMGPDDGVFVAAVRVVVWFIIFYRKVRCASRLWGIRGR